MKTIYAFVACGIAAITASPAFAQQGSDQPMAGTPAAAFSGPFVEASVGWDHLANKSTKDIDPTAYTTGTADGVAFGGAVGYDYPVTRNVTVGAEVGIYGSSTRWNNSSNLVAGTFNTASVRAGRDLFVGGKVGYALNRSTQVFGKAGYTNARFGITGDNGNDPQYQAINASGFRLGAGVERKLTRATYVKFEYDYSHYGSGQFNYGGATPDASNFDLHTDRHQVLASVGYRF